MKLIICADDFAQSPEIDAAIIRLIENNRLTAASCMVNSPHWASSAKLLTTDIRDKAHIGLHLDFTLFGYRYPHAVLTVLSVLRCLPTRAIKNSIEHQLNQFEAALGTQPDYVDGHQHVHQLPQIRQVLLSVLKQRYHQQLPWIRIAKPDDGSGIKGRIIKMLGASALEREAKQLGFKCSSELLGVYDFSGDTHDYKKRLVTWAKQAGKGIGTSVLMCHPAIESVNGHINDPIYPARINEFKVLSSDAFSTIFNQVNIVREP